MIKSRFYSALFALISWLLNVIIEFRWRFTKGGWWPLQHQIERLRWWAYDRWMETDPPLTDDHEREIDYDDYFDDYDNAPYDNLDDELDRQGDWMYQYDPDLDDDHDYWLGEDDDE